MTHGILAGKRVLITHADEFMGPILCDVFKEQGANVIGNTVKLSHPDEPKQIIDAAGNLDVLVVNLSVKAPATAAAEVAESEWQEVFTRLVDPLPRLVRAILPQMTERGSGKILLIGSASALRGMKWRSTYSAARGAQLGYIQAVGVEVARHNIQVNAVAQNFVENPTYFPPEVQTDERFKERVKWEVPLGRLVGDREAAEFAAYLCSDSADCFVGQVFPVSGGWAMR